MDAKEWLKKNGIANSNLGINNKKNVIEVSVLLELYVKDLKLFNDRK